MKNIKLLSVIFVGLTAGSAFAQTSPEKQVIVPEVADQPFAAPQQPTSGRRYEKLPGTSGRADFVVSKINALIRIDDNTAETRLDFAGQNLRNQPIEVELAVPLPAKRKPAAKSKSANTPNKNTPDNTNGTELSAEQSDYQEWQRLAVQLAHPGPIEFCGNPLMKTKPTQFAAGESKTVSAKYKQNLEQHGTRCDFVLPRSERIEANIPWSMQVNLKSPQPVATVYSPTHRILPKRISANEYSVFVDEQAAAQPGEFRLSYLKDQGEMSATLYVQPDASKKNQEGTFLFLAAVSPTVTDQQAIPRELTLAIDRSGSMQGPKIDQVRTAATKALEELNENESFNIITYNHDVNSFRETPVKNTEANRRQAEQFIADMKPRGGTNLHKALDESLRQKPTPQSLPIVLFLTDGLATVGETEEDKIQKLAKRDNAFGRRVYTVGVGVNVNTPLLESIASDSRGTPTFVLPGQKLEERLSDVIRKLRRPLFADAKLEVADPSGIQRVQDLFPNPLPDLYRGDHLVVLGKYQGQAPLMFRLSGNYLGERRTFEFRFPIAEQPTSPFVARLWAGRKIASLVQAIRETGAETDPYVILGRTKQDPEVRKHAEEVLELTMRYGILTEYTAFLAQPNTTANQREQLDKAYKNFDDRAVKTRVGLSSVNQSINNTLLQCQQCLNNGNYFFDSKMNRVGTNTVQQLGSGAFFLRGNTWVDGELLNSANTTPLRVVPFGSQEYQDLLSRYVSEGKHVPLSLGENVLLQVDQQPVLIQSSPVNNSGAVQTSPAQSATSPRQ